MRELSRHHLVDSMLDKEDAKKIRNMESGLDSLSFSLSLQDSYSKENGTLDFDKIKKLMGKRIK